MTHEHHNHPPVPKFKVKTKEGQYLTWGDGNPLHLAEGTDLVVFFDNFSIERPTTAPQYMQIDPGGRDYVDRVFGATASQVEYSWSWARSPANAIKCTYKDRDYFIAREATSNCIYISHKSEDALLFEAEPV